jgi:hypothetical protein
MGPAEPDSLGLHAVLSGCVGSGRRRVWAAGRDWGGGILEEAGWAAGGQGLAFLGEVGRFVRLLLLKG